MNNLPSQDCETKKDCRERHTIIENLKWTEQMSLLVLPGQRGVFIHSGKDTALLWGAVRCSAVLTSSMLVPREECSEGKEPCHASVHFSL